MSMLAGCTQDGSKGSMPMRPDAIAARMSRSESTTAAKYGLAAAREREDLLAQLRPRGDDVVRALDASAREAPEHLDRPRARGLSHRDVRVRVPNDHALARVAPQPHHRVECEIRRRLVLRDRIAAEVDVDLVSDPESAKDPLAVRGAFARDRRLKQTGLVERMQCLARALEQLRGWDDLAIVDVAVFGAIPLSIIGREIGPRQTEDRFERQTGHRPDALERKRRSPVRLDDAIRGVDDEANAVGERAIEIPEHGAQSQCERAGEGGAAGDAASGILASESGGAPPAEERRANGTGGEANSRARSPSRGRTRGAPTTACGDGQRRPLQVRWAASSAPRTVDRALPVEVARALRARYRERRDPAGRRRRS